MTLRRTTIGVLVLYALLTVYPIVSIASGVAPSPLITPVSTLAGFAFALLHAGQREGWARALRLLALVFGVSLLFESVGVATGLIYGPYHYTDQLGPLFLGLVPYLIPVAWFMMSYPSFVIADRLIPGGWKHWQRILAVGVGWWSGDDRLGPGDGSDHGCQRALGLGRFAKQIERSLSWDPSAKLLGLVADRLYHLCPLPVDLGQSLQTP